MSTAYVPASSSLLATQIQRQQSGKRHVHKHHSRGTGINTEQQSHTQDRKSHNLSKPTDRMTLTLLTSPFSECTKFCTSPTRHFVVGFIVLSHDVVQQTQLCAIHFLFRWLFVRRMLSNLFVSFQLPLFTCENKNNMLVFIKEFLSVYCCTLNEML